jgi:hypothetical protein
MGIEKPVNIIFLNLRLHLVEASDTWLLVKPCIRDNLHYIGCATIAC